MANKFVSWLESVGKDIEHGLARVLPYAETAGEVAVSLFAPSLGPLFNSTIAAVVTAEQSAAAIGQQAGTGVQKLAAVVQLMGPLISQSLLIAGKQGDTVAVQNYINSIVTILNAIPASSTAAVQANTAATWGTPAIQVK